jgi:radical SAM superfamily enzyme with C-terminal helix-hairpin-helix motif
MCAAAWYNNKANQQKTKELKMADRKIVISDLIVDGEDKKGNPVFEASGTLNDVGFVARTIQYQGDPIFKLQENGEHRAMAESQYTRGDRIAVARACKAMRLELFGSGQKALVDSELEAGETVELVASDDEGECDQE